METKKFSYTTPIIFLFLIVTSVFFWLRFNSVRHIVVEKDVSGEIEYTNDAYSTALFSLKKHKDDDIYIDLDSTMQYDTNNEKTVSMYFGTK